MQCANCRGELEPYGEQALRCRRCGRVYLYDDRTRRLIPAGKDIATSHPYEDYDER